MTSVPYSRIWPALWADMHHPEIAWQVLTLLACLLAGSLIGRLLRRMFGLRDSRPRLPRLDIKSFARVLTPMVTLGLLVVAKAVLQHWQHVNLLRIAIPLAASFALIRFGFYVLHQVFARGDDVGAVLLKFEKIFAALVWIIVLLHMTSVWPELVRYLDDIELPTGRYRISAWTILQAVVSVSITLLLALWAGATIEERLMRVDQLHMSLRVAVARMGRAVLILVAVLASLAFVGIDLTVLSVFGGALGVGIGLGLQKIVGSYVSGFVILIERSLTIGDMVAVDKYFGRVTQINTRFTILRGFDGVEIVVPNDMLVSGMVQNYSLSDRAQRVATQLTVGYETDIEPLLRQLEQTVAGIPRVSKEPAPHALLLRFGADGLELEVGFWISDPENGRGSVLSNVNQAIWRLLQANGITIPYPQREVRLVQQAQ